MRDERGEPEAKILSAPPEPAARAEKPDHAFRLACRRYSEMRSRLRSG